MSYLDLITIVIVSLGMFGGNMLTAAVRTWSSRRSWRKYEEQARSTSDGRR